MSRYQLPFKIEPLTFDDIPEVDTLEQTAFAADAPLRDYVQELEQNQLAHYFVLRTSLFQTPGESLMASSAGFPAIVGLGGFWLISGEIHIMTLAIHPNWHQLGLGEWLLLSLLEIGAKMGGQLATLEVRPSNRAALALYKKYLFEKKGRRPNYYSNNEDALILTTPAFSLPDYQAMLVHRKNNLLARLATIKADKTHQIN